jgi:putative DNA primase/helicase
MEGIDMAFIDRSSVRTRSGQPVGWRDAAIPADQIAATLQLEADEHLESISRPAKKSQKSNLRPAEDMYAQSIEDSKLWAKAQDSGLIYRWNGFHWEERQQEACETDALLWLRRVYSDQACGRKATACVQTARLLMPDLPPMPDGRCVIPCIDGWLEMLGERFVRIVPDKSIGVTHSIRARLGDLPIGAEYIPGPVSGLFADYLDLSLPDLSVRAMVQEYVGYTLLPHSFLNLQVAMIFMGDGADGKGVMAGLMRNLHRRTCAMNLKSLDGFGAEGLIGATLALVDEGPTRGTIDDERIKTMISGDALDINRKHKPAITYAPVAKWVISANDTPRFGSAGRAIARRFLFAPWTASLDEKKRIPNLGSRIAKTELKVVLDWALAGAIALVKRGCFETPKPAAALKQDALRSMDTVLGWMDDAEPRVVDSAQTPKYIIYKDYEEWCNSQGQRAVRAETFWKRLRQYLSVTDKDLAGPRPTIDKKRVQTVRLLIHQDPDEPAPF